MAAQAIRASVPEIRVWHPWRPPGGGGAGVVGVAHPTDYEPQSEPGGILLMRKNMLRAKITESTMPKATN